MVTAEVVAENLSAVKRRIEQAGGDPESIGILAVSKTFDAGCVEAACDAGLRRFGENYAAELVAKAAVVAGSGTGSAVNAFSTSSSSRVVRLGAFSPPGSTRASLARTMA